jgi:hypothetical protein
MNRAMALTTKHDEVRFAIRSRVASPNDVMDLELISPAALLALPPVPFKDSDAKL